MKMIDKYNFQIGEEVIDTCGRKGKIVNVCKCEECEKRGFYEPTIKWEYTLNLDYVTNLYEKDGFPNIHSIGNRIFHPYNKAYAKREIERLEDEILSLEKQVKFLSKGIELIEKENK